MGFSPPFLYGIERNEHLWRSNVYFVHFQRQPSCGGPSFPVKFYDLSQPVYHNSPEWPGQGPTVVNRVATVAVDGVNKECVTLSTHSGTHVDVPFHFIDDGAAVDKVPIETFAGPAIAIDVRGKVQGDCIARKDVEPYAAVIAPGDIVLLNTGWGKIRAHTQCYLSGWPYISADAARWLIAAGIKGVGTDAVSAGIAGDPNATRATHLALLSEGRFIVEDLCIPDELMDGKKRWFCAFPILLRGCGAGWARAVAMDFEDRQQ